MILVNLWGGPGSGKTTLAYYLTYRFKVDGFLAEFVGETARESHIYNSAFGAVPPQLLDNQVLVAAQQYERILRLKRHGVEIAISDSPLLMSLMYCRNEKHRHWLDPLLGELDREFNTLTVFVNRSLGYYKPESRVQKTEQEAIEFDIRARALCERIDCEAHWHDEWIVYNRLLAKVNART